MRNVTRELFNIYLSGIAELNGVSKATESFSVDPSIAQVIETKMQESSDFLGKINIYPVTELIGDTVGVVSTGPIASRTNTDTKDRQTADATGETSRRYKCEETDYNTHIKWAKLDMWAKFPDFETRIRDVIINQQALDRIMIGWNGTHVAPESDKVANPLLQDLNIGWLQSMRLEAPEQVMGSTTVAGASDAVAGVTTPDPIKVGPNEEYKNLDAVAMDLTEYLAPWHRERTDLVVICGRKLLHDKYFPVVNQTNKPTETLASDIVVSQKRIGGHPAVRVPFFPDNAMLVTTLDNLSIYVQEQSRRRKVEDNARRKRIENFESSNDDYIVEDFELAALAENIEFVEADDAGAGE
ncbi:phage major capsid protein, P2 family [Sphingomonas sp. PR090111-T3T-6A]|uniref:phage major capsid protein, P2 family n=1 Tax=Sphingomonas sp. PR090111-T3T-6A TaxID=685778 RepID=UPI000372D9AA|nr:phage major capsid protein, P2 family [Sphingomonas sp. PR090111-T3T-6A]